MYGDKLLPEKLDIVGPKGQLIPNSKINLDYYLTKEQFQSLYYEKKLNFQQIINLIEYPYDKSTFSRILRKYGYKTDLGSPKKYEVNSNYFKSINREVAWVLGWLITDGHIHDKYVELTLQSKDIDVLYKVSNALDFTGQMYVREGHNKLRVYDTTLVKDLRKLGFPSKNKTFDCKTPEVAKSYMWDFMRGAFEGDGSALIDAKNGFKVSFCGASKDFMWEVYEFLVSNGIECDLKETKVGFYTIKASGMENSLRWMYFMYANTTEAIRMNRKYQTYKTFVETFYDRPRKVSGAVELVELARQTIFNAELTHN